MFIPEREQIDEGHELVFSEEERTFYIERLADKAISDRSYQTMEIAKQALELDEIKWLT